MSDFVCIYFMGLFRSPEKTPISCVWLLASQNPGGLEGKHLREVSEVESTRLVFP